MPVIQEEIQHPPKLRCTNDFVFKTLLTYFPALGQKFLKNISEELMKTHFEALSLSPTEKLSPSSSGKDVRLDISVQTIPMRLINYEMQGYASEMNICNRSAYYAAMLLTQPANKGAAYSELVPVSQVFFLDFPFPPKADQPDKAIHVYQLQEKDEHDVLTNLITIYIIELKKIIQMNHSYQELDGFEKWCWFFEKYDEEISDPIVAEIIQRNDIFKEVVEVMKVISSDPAIRNAACAHERDLRDKAQIKYDGIQEGIQEGIQLNQLQNAQAMLKDHVPDELILKYIGIRSDQLNSLKAQIASSLIQESEASYDISSPDSPAVNTTEGTEPDESQ